MGLVPNYCTKQYEPLSKVFYYLLLSFEQKDELEVVARYLLSGFKSRISAFHFSLPGDSTNRECAVVRNQLPTLHCQKHIV